tara:strand:- start:5 stop:1372 length:1368 start_codon:yes stop_codon:yes gene_type:complete
MSRARELAGFATATNPIQDLNVGVVTAISFSGDGSSLTGIDATSIKDGGGTIRAQANTSGVVVTGILTATSLEGDGSALTGLPAGLGTAVSASGDGANIYFTDQVLEVGSNLSIDVPSSAVVAYTQYPEVAISNGIDLTIADGDDFVADILGIGTTGAPQLLAGGGGRVRADNFVAKDGYNAPTFANGINVTGVVTATTSVQVSSGGTFGSNGASAAVYYGDGSNLTGIAATADVSTSTLNVIGVSTFGGRIAGAATSNVIPFLYSTVSDLPSASTYHGAFAHVHNQGAAYFAHAANWYQLVHRELNGNVSISTATGICTALTLGPGLIQEDYNNYGSALTGTYNHDVVTNGMVLHSTVAASGTFVINLRGDGSTTFNSLMNVGQTAVLTVYSVSSNTSYYLTDFQIDGSSITEKWNGGSAPSAGTGSGTDVYTFNIMKTADATFTVFANFSNFA